MQLWKTSQHSPRQRAWAISNSRYTAILDACVLYPAPLRDLLLEMSAIGLFRAKWTEKIHGEWISNLLINRADLTFKKLARTKDLMNRAVADCLVEDYEALMAGLTLPDRDDCHVLAAAIHCGADAVITFNLKDFPPDMLSPYAIEPQHPDEFIDHQFKINAAAVLNAAHRCRLRLKNPPLNSEQYLLALERCGLPQSVVGLREFSDII